MIFTKMHECGNDCILVVYDKNVNYSNLAIKILNRRIGIGADVLIVVKIKPLEMIPYNAKGEIINNCNIGIRCFSKYCYEHKIVKNKFDIILGFNKIKVEVINDNPFRSIIDYGYPQFKNNMLYISDVIDSFGRVIKIDDATITTYSINLGCVNTIVFVNDLNEKTLNYAQRISNYKIFNRKTNVSFVKVIDKSTIKVKTYDNLNGWVFSNEIAASAAVICSNELNLVSEYVDVEFEYGTIRVEYKKTAKVIASAVNVFECEFKEETLC